MTRWWTESVAALGDVVPLPIAALLLLLAASLAAAGWYWWPRWVPRRLPRWHLPWVRLRRPRLRWLLRLLRPRWPFRRRRRAPVTADPAAPAQPGDDELPDLPAAAFASLADRLAAQGRYAEAVRERLRAMVRELIERRVVEHRPGWTVTELAGAAAKARPVVDEPLREAGGVFSDVWYGQRPAEARHDDRMRELADQLHRALS
ncbi:DUF4129 domain-containing protein [Phytohabitans rumicis]|uniref:Protein-glutamine gamma-glutamyltransferase-like C-terminal domain-containing protein n=1 Tax=Phytohabitans rumicis TaxID=1076125 RepID=A0A6V8LAE0_9ACTN|nr:DUF4129 domain-containing protein [Phytohabitans rumicis]GFJ91519.1 hypothetical protein Prum_051610 [Phytohabitans rumicis]